MDSFDQAIAVSGVAGRLVAVAFIGPETNHTTGAVREDFAPQ